MAVYDRSKFASLEKFMKAERGGRGEKAVRSFFVNDINKRSLANGK